MRYVCRNAVLPRKRALRSLIRSILFHFCPYHSLETFRNASEMFFSTKRTLCFRVGQKESAIVPIDFAFTKSLSIEL